MNDFHYLNGNVFSVNEKVEGSRLSASSSKKTTPTTTAFASTVVSEGLRAGWPSILTLLTRDQYGHLVHVPNLKVSETFIISSHFQGLQVMLQ